MAWLGGAESEVCSRGLNGGEGVATQQALVVPGEQRRGVCRG
jgi:hypothetical protein